MLNDRFWTKVNRDAPNDCWEWTANKNNHGYGMFSLGAVVGKKLAHRLSFEDAKGPIPIGGLILHSCDNPACVNPDHLRVGTHKDNTQDCFDRKRRTLPPVISGPDHWRNRYPERVLHGQEVPTSKLTTEQVIALRIAYVSGVKYDVLSAEYGLPVHSLKDITTGISWQHILGLYGSPTLNELKAFGKQNQKSNSKITQEIAIEIRSRLANGAMGKDLAIEYGLHKATISDIKLRKIWPD